MSEIFSFGPLDRKTPESSDREPTFRTTDLPRPEEVLRDRPASTHGDDLRPTDLRRLGFPSIDAPAAGTGTLLWHRLMRDGKVSGDPVRPTPAPRTDTPIRPVPIPIERTSGVRNHLSEAARRQPEITRDDLGRVARVEYPGGKKVREFKYRGETSEIASIKIHDKDTGTVRTFTRGRGDQWSIHDSKRGNVGTWRGEASISDTGVYAFRSRVNGKLEPWRTFLRDNREVSHERKRDGSSVLMDTQGRVTDVRRKDGSELKCFYSSDRKLSRFEEIGADKQKKIFSRDVQGKFVSQPSGEVRSNVIVRKNGDLVYNSGKDNFRHSTDGKIEKYARDGSDHVRSARERLSRAAEGKIPAATLKEYMDTLEQRCHETKEKGFKAPSKFQISRALNNLAQVLEAPNSGKPFMDEQRRVMAVTSALRNLAKPREINQGSNPTCNVTTGERFMAARHPEKYGALIRDICLKGETTSHFGSTVRPKPMALRPGAEERNLKLDLAAKEGERNFASKLVQVTMISAYRPEYVSGSPHFYVSDILRSTKAVTGQDMPYISHRPTAEELLERKRKGEFPIGIVTKAGRHVETIEDVKMENGKLKVLVQDQKGKYGLDGWMSLAALHHLQKEQKPKWKDIKKLSRGI